jgi:3-phytase
MAAVVGVLATCLSMSAAAAVRPPAPIASDAETVPVLHSGDAMDDPAVWVHPVDPSQSLVIGNDKGGALESYDLDGRLVERLQVGTEFWGNVDVRQRVTINGRTHDLVGASQRSVRFYDVDPTTRLLSPATEGGAPIGAVGEGFCLYDSPFSDSVYGISITIAGVVRQFELLDADGDGMLESRIVREFSVGSEAEGCVADDRTGALYISEEDRALWRYGAEPSADTTRQAVDVLASQGGQLANDIEGVTLVDSPNGEGYVIVSAQNAANPNASYFSVYRRGAGNAFVTNFRVGDGVTSDDCDRTDGITAVATDLGPAFPNGIFVCQDNNNDAPGSIGNQNLKFVRLEKVLALDTGPSNPPSAIGFVGASSTNANSTRHTVTVPATVTSGDALLLLVAQSGTTPVTGPGSGWTQVGRVVDSTHATTAWRKVATASDAGTRIQLSYGTTLVKASVTLVAYTGTDGSDPIAVIAGRAEPATTAEHATPTVTNTGSGAWRVSFWSDNNSSTTRWTAPTGEVVRAMSAGTGGGRVGTLLSDPGAPLPADTTVTGGLVARADAASSKATAWTLLLRPRTQ